MRTPTAEQQAVLDSPARVRVVRSAPGSGKTWLVAELIRQELDKWPTKTSGIAALSFTRVGGDEIRKAMGYELGHPHFVGTIDAFLFRYVVRPFLNKCFPSLATPRLIPGEWGAGIGRTTPENEQATFGNGINLFGCVFIDENERQSRELPTNLIPRVRCSYWIMKRRLSRMARKSNSSRHVKKQMMRRWERSGLSHIPTPLCGQAKSWGIRRLVAWFAQNLSDDFRSSSWMNFRMPDFFLARVFVCYLRSPPLGVSW